MNEEQWERARKVYETAFADPALRREERYRKIDELMASVSQSFNRKLMPMQPGEYIQQGSIWLDHEGNKVELPPDRAIQYHSEYPLPFGMRIETDEELQQRIEAYGEEE